MNGYKYTKRSSHPYEPYIPIGATKLIIGTIPPYRFCHKDTNKLFATDVDFYYGSKDNCFWDIMAEIFNVKLRYINSNDAIKERIEILNLHNIGITDIVKSCDHKDGKSGDSALENVECKDIVKLLEEHNSITELIYTSESVKKYMYGEVKNYHSWDENKIDGKITINGRIYTVKMLYSPSPNALRGVTSEMRISRYRDVFVF